MYNAQSVAPPSTINGAHEYNAIHAVAHPNHLLSLCASCTSVYAYYTYLLALFSLALINHNTK